MNPIKVEIGQVRNIDKGSLKAEFSVVIYPEGQKILGCKYFIMGDNRWFCFPQKKIDYSDGRKSDYIPYVSYLNKEYKEQLSVAILQALKEYQPPAYNGKAQYKGPQRQASQLPPQAPSDGELPF